MKSWGPSDWFLCLMSLVVIGGVAASIYIQDFSHDGALCRSKGGSLDISTGFCAKTTYVDTVIKLH